MPDPTVTASGERFARDMRRIREEHGVSMERIHQETMISVHIIESFEQDGLFEHPTFNRVYLRSFVRSYAQAVDVDPDRAVEELERALEGEYANELAVEYLGDEPEEPPVPSGAAAAGDQEEEAPVEQTVSASGLTSESVSAPGPEESAEPAAEPADVAGLPEGGQQGIIIGVGIVIVAVLAWVLIGVLRDTDQNATSESAAQPAMTDTARGDTTQLEPIPAESLQASSEPTVVIGDTMYFTVIAQERVNPIRIRRDDDLRRPYYLNRGQAGVFPAQQQIVLEQALDNIRLLVNGHEYPVAAHTFGGRLVLNRDTVRTFLDTTQTEPLSLVVPADTFQVLGS